MPDPARPQPGVRRAPVQRRSASTVDAVLDAASSLLARVPIGEINTTRIAGEAGLSVGALYRFYPGKQAIFDAIAVRHMTAFRSTMARVLARSAFSSAPAFLARLLDAYIAFLDAHPDFRTLALGGHISSLARQTQASPTGGPAALLRAFLKKRLGIRDSATLDLRLSVAIEAGERLIAFAYRQPSPEARRRVLAELKRLLSCYLFS